MQHEVVVEAGADGGSFALYQRLTPTGERCFFTELNQAAHLDLMERLGGAPPKREPVGRSGYVATFEQGLQLLDSDPSWVWLYPVRVHPEFASRVLAAVEERLHRDERGERDGQRALERWRRKCGA